MTTLRCEQARAMLMAYLDSELDANSTLSVTEHLATCAGCRTRFEAEGRLEESLVATLRAGRMPADVRARISASLPGRRRVPRLRREVVLLAAAAVVLVAVALVFHDALGGGDLEGLPLVLRVTASHRAVTSSTAGFVAQDAVDDLLAAAGFGEMDLAHTEIVGGHGVELLGARREDLDGVPAIHVAYLCCGVPTSVFLMHRLDFADLPEALRPGLVDGATLTEHRDAFDARFGWRADVVVGVVGEAHHMEPGTPLLR